jgi:GNAT superfamily N-acetyltransferase
VRIEYRTSAEGLRWEQLDGFFVGWPVRPSASTLLDHLVRSYRCVVAVDLSKEPDRVVGFATAISDGLLSASIPMVEVLPGWHERGIGTELVTRLLDQLRHLYLIDLVCDDDVVPFYEKLGLTPARAMVRRNRKALEPLAEDT